jgi:hypothetical protein
MGKVRPTRRRADAYPENNLPPLNLNQFKTAGQKAAVVKGRINANKEIAEKLRSLPVKRDILFKQDLTTGERQYRIEKLNRRNVDLSKTLGRVGTDKTDAIKRARSAAIAKVREKQKVESKNKNFVSRKNMK